MLFIVNFMSDFNNMELIFFVDLSTQVFSLMENLRSGIAKNAMTAVSEMAKSMKKSIEAALEDCFSRLFRKV